jgi:bleomycin hydrolase
MKKAKYLSVLVIITLVFSAMVSFGQEKYYELTSVKELKTNQSVELKRVGTCWSNAGAAFFEAEMLRLGKEPVNLSPLHFVYSAYLEKAKVFLDENQLLKVDPSGTAFDVVRLTEKYGMVPESEFMYAEDEMLSTQKQGEMDAILRGTLNMIHQQGEGFSERWENVYNTSLLRYMGESKIEFTYKSNSYNAKSFAGASGLNMDDYAMLTWVPKSDLNKKVEPVMRQNWAESDFYNVSGSDLVGAIENSINNGFTVVWYGHIDGSQIFSDENMAIVPAGDLPDDEESEEETETEFKPFAEMQVTPEMHDDLFKKVGQRDQDFLLIYGLTTDQEENTYFTGKYVCKAGDKTLNISRSFIELNTIYLMVNTNGLSSAMRTNLGL